LHERQEYERQCKLKEVRKTWETNNRIVDTLINELKGIQGIAADDTEDIRIVDEGQDIEDDLARLTLSERIMKFQAALWEIDTIFEPCEVCGGHFRQEIQIEHWHVHKMKSMALFASRSIQPVLRDTLRAVVNTAFHKGSTEGDVVNSMISKREDLHSVMKAKLAAFQDSTEASSDWNSADEIETDRILMTSHTLSHLVQNLRAEIKAAKAGAYPAALANEAEMLEDSVERGHKWSSGIELRDQVVVCIQAAWRGSALRSERRSMGQYCKSRKEMQLQAIANTISSTMDSEIVLERRPNGQVYVGEVNQEEEPDGIGLEFDEAWANPEKAKTMSMKSQATNGQLPASSASKSSWYIGNFKSGHKEGLGILTRANGSKYEGTWMHNQQHGEGAESYKDGAVYQGQFEGNARKGCGVYTFVNGYMLGGQWSKGVQNGFAFSAQPSQMLTPRQFEAFQYQWGTRLKTATENIDRETLVSEIREAMHRSVLAAAEAQRQAAEIAVLFDDAVQLFLSFPWIQKVHGRSATQNESKVEDNGQDNEDTALGAADPPSTDADMAPISEEEAGLDQTPELSEEEPLKIDNSLKSW